MGQKRDGEVVVRESPECNPEHAFFNSSWDPFYHSSQRPEVPLLLNRGPEYLLEDDGG